MQLDVLVVDILIVKPRHVDRYAASDYCAMQPCPGLRASAAAAYWTVCAGGGACADAQSRTVAGGMHATLTGMLGNWVQRVGTCAFDIKS